MPAYQVPVMVWSPHERAEAILRQSGAFIRFGGDQAYYRSGQDVIQLPPKDRSFSNCGGITTEWRYTNWDTGPAIPRV